ncbi:MAG: alpha/beta hydrolase [Pseudomonadota bacterium]
MVLTETGWGSDNPAYRHLFSQTFMPDASPAELDWFDNFQRQTTSPQNAVRFLEAFSTIDVRDRLSEVRCPTLVVHRRGDQRIPSETARSIASRIPDAQIAGVESSNHLLLGQEKTSEQFMDLVRDFLADNQSHNSNDSTCDSNAVYNASYHAALACSAPAIRATLCGPACNTVKSCTIKMMRRCSHPAWGERGQRTRTAFNGSTGLIRALWAHSKLWSKTTGRIFAPRHARELSRAGASFCPGPYCHLLRPAWLNPPRGTPIAQPKSRSFAEARGSKKSVSTSPDPRERISLGRLCFKERKRPPCVAMLRK